MTVSKGMSFLSLLLVMFYNIYQQIKFYIYSQNQITLVLLLNVIEGQLCGVKIVSTFNENEKGYL